MKNWHDWDNKKATALLHRLYKFLDNLDFPMYFNSARCREVGDQADGFISYLPDKKGKYHIDAIYFDPKPSQPLLTVFIHELLHAIYYQMEEYQISHIAEQVTAHITDKQAANVYKRMIKKIK